VRSKGEASKRKRWRGEDCGGRKEEEEQTTMDYLVHEQRSEETREF
jgi:hypothetical protein